MKTQRIELEVDFVGGQEPLTKEEEVALSAYFQSRRLIRQVPFRQRYKKRSENAVFV
jgi:hypothetical protein